MIIGRLKKYISAIGVFLPLSSFAVCPFEHYADVVTACTGDNALGIVYPVGTSGTDVPYFPLRPNKRTGKGYTHGIGCLDETPSPAWYAIKIDEPGTMLLNISHSKNEDIDFVCWGPFRGDTKQEMLESVCAKSDVYFADCKVPNTSNDCVTEKLKQCEAKYGIGPNSSIYDRINSKDSISKCKGEIERRSLVDTDYECFYGNSDAFPIAYMIDCSFSRGSSESCVIENAKRGDWYLILVTNFSGVSGNVKFEKIHGNATTDCSVIVDVGNSGPVCEGEPLQLYVNNAPAFSTCEWHGPNGFTSTANPHVINDVKKSDSGKYYVTVTTHDGLKSDEMSTVVNVISNEPVDTTIRVVDGDVVEFKGAKFDKSGKYKVTESAGDCSRTYNVTVVVVPGLPTYTMNSGPVCDGDSVTLTIGEEPETGVEGYVWSGPNGFSSKAKNPVVRLNSRKVGEYSLRIKKDGLMYPTKPTTVEMIPRAQTTIVEKIRLGSSIVFGGKELDKRGVYTDTLQSSYGCDSIVEMVLQVEMPDIIPSTIVSPNGDGVNDTWVIGNIDLYPDATVSIYDRYGRSLLVVDKYMDEWDGVDRYGRNLPSDDYWYEVDIPSIDRVYTGHFTLIRSK